MSGPWLLSALLLGLALGSSIAAPTSPSVPSSQKASDGVRSFFSIQEVRSQIAARRAQQQPTPTAAGDDQQKTRPSLKAPSWPQGAWSLPEGILENPFKQDFAKKGPSGTTATLTRHLPKRYIVQVTSQPAAVAMVPSEDGSTASTASAPDATAPGSQGHNVALARIQAQAVAAQIDSVAAAVGIKNKITREFTYALSGFVVNNPTSAELEALAANPAVVSITPDTLKKISTYSSPDFLGLTTPQTEGAGEEQDVQGRHPEKGVWDQLGGVLGPNGAGEASIVGILDTGMWIADHPSFADKDYWASAENLEGQEYAPISDKRWRGTCTPDVDGTPFPCNNKVIGCRYYASGFGGNGAIKENFPEEYAGCKDADGHGTHTASTAAGNYGAVSPLAPKGALLSGMAPRARLAVYKVCWGTGDNAGCWDSDIVAAVDDAIQDGVNVINYSIGSNVALYSFKYPSDIAFLNAARAGIFVAAAAGNNGPGASTVNNLAPYITTVAASSQDRTLMADLTLGDGQTFSGSGNQPIAVGPLKLVYAGDAALNPEDVNDAARCFNGTLDPAKVNNAIVVCKRGTSALIDKAKEVARAGGKGMVLLNVPGGLTNLAEVLMAVPYVQLLAEHHDAVITYAQTAGATATLGASVATQNTTAPQMASFSSRGPILIANGALMKPDITAPGVNIHAASSPQKSFLGEVLYETMSGTSMATPHIAGVAALLHDAHPRWTPMMIKSAIMTTAYTKTKTGDAGQPFGTALDYGAGHVNPAAALNPGLVVASTDIDWQRFLCSVEGPITDPNCKTLCPFKKQPVELQAIDHKRHHTKRDHHYHSPKHVHNYDDSDSNDDRHDLEHDGCSAYGFNGPWVAGDTAGSLTVTRTLTAVCHEDGPVHFKAVASADEGSHMDIEARPRSVTLRHGESVTVAITVTPTAETPLSTYQFGQVVWRSNAGHVVRIPVSVNFLDFLAPTTITPAVKLPSFSYTYDIKANNATSVNITASQLTRGDTWEASIPTGTSQALLIELAEGNDYVAFGLFAADYVPGTWLALTVYDLDGNVKGQASNYNADNFVEASHGLPAGSYVVEVGVLMAPSSSVDVKLYGWGLYLQRKRPEAGADMKVSPNPVPVNPEVPAPVQLTFSGMNFTTNPINRYIGFLDYAPADGGAFTFPSTRSFVYLT